jgi:hypothetical protein
LEESSSTTSPPPADSEDRVLEKKRKRVGDLASSSTSVPKDASGEPAVAKDSGLEMFELLDSFVFMSLLHFAFRVFLSLTLFLLLDVE